MEAESACGFDAAFTKTGTNEGPPAEILAAAKERGDRGWGGDVCPSIDCSSKWNGRKVYDAFDSKEPSECGLQ